MIFIYFLSDGEIHQVGKGWKTLEEFYGHRANEMSRVFGAVYFEYDDYVYSNHFRFKIDVNTKELIMTKQPAYISNLLNKSSNK